MNDKRLHSFFKKIFLAPRCPLCYGEAYCYGFCDACWQDIATLKTPENRCFQCARIMTVASICGDCQNKKWAFEALWASYQYQVPLSALIHHWKYQKRIDLSTCIAQLLMQHIPDWLNTIHIDAILAMPISHKRLLERGFNQALELAHHASRYLDAPLISPQLVLRKYRIPQSELPRQKRLKNVRNCFDVQLSKIPKKILLIDDVVTTGATLNELALSLKRAGVQQVFAWVLLKKQD